MDRQQRIGSRTPLACDECRRSKTKCSGTRPFCRRCTRRKTVCTWPPGIPESSVSAQSPSALPPGKESTITHTEAPPEHLLDIFHARHHDVEFCSFLHRPTTMAELYTQSPFLSTAIASLASIYDSDAQKEKDVYTDQATILGRGVSDQPSISNIQGFLVLAVRQLVAWRDLVAWMHAGTAIRMAQALQLDKEDALLRSRHTNKQREVRRRTFWACFVVDRLISYACHHRFSIDLGSSLSLNLLARLPCSENTFAFGEADTGPAMEDLLSSQTASTLPTPADAPRSLSRLGIAPFYISLVKLWGDMSLLHVTGGRRQMTLLPTDPASPFSQASHAISAFMDQLPPTLHWSPENYALFKSISPSTAAAFVHFNFVLHHARCVMHHEYLPQLDVQYYAPLDDLVMLDAAGLPPSYINRPLIDTCIHAINTITEMVAVVSREDDSTILQSTVAGNALMTAAAVHLWVVYTQTCDRCPKHVARANFERLLGVVESWEAQWPVAAAWSQTLGMLYKLYKFSYGAEPVPEFLSWEVDDRVEIHNDDKEKQSESGMSYGDADPDSIGQCLHGKVRGILANPLHPPEVKRKSLRVFSQTLWQNLWGSSLFGELEFGLDVNNYL